MNHIKTNINSVITVKLFFLLILTFFSIFSFAQDKSYYVEIKISIKYGKNPVEGAKIEVFDGASLVKTVTTNYSGKENIKLDFDKEYIFKISKETLVPKKISINTYVGESKGKEYVYPYKFTIELFDMIEGLDISSLEKPVSKIKFFDNLGDFDFDPAYTESMRSEISKIIRQLEILTKKRYTVLIVKADKLLREKKYKEAHDVYDEAISYADEYDYYPEDQLDKCEKLMAEQKSNEGEYDRTIVSADHYFDTENYSSAKTNYEKASKLKPEEKYPKERLNEIKKILAQQKADKAAAEKDKTYNDAIARADGFFNSKKYNEAKIEYNKALGIKSSEQYPKDKISEIDKILANQKATTEKDKSYKDAIAKADGFFNGKKYNEAKSEYNKALGIKSGEQYPKDKISEIDKILADQKATAEKDKAYQDAISKADGFFNGKKYTEAKSEYNKALGIKSGEQYPKDKISEIDKILANQKAAAEKDKAYQDAIAKADGFFNGKKYTEAKSEYNKALGIKSGEQYPKDKISEIDKILADQKAAAEKDKSYQDAIAKADGFFNGKKYTEAKSEYNKALGIKSDEQYPKDKISEIDKILANQKAATEKDKAYQDAIAKADGFFNGRKYNEAKIEYNKALGIKSGEQYPKDKISEIDKILADQKATAEKDKSYQDAISKADGFFNSKKYNEAKSEYNKALGIKSGEQYPKDKISEIDKILAGQKAVAEKDKTYQDAIAKADGFFNGKKYNEAKGEYNKALGIKSTEQYPKDKISEIDKILSDQKAATEKDKNYQDAITKADGFFNGKKYNESKSEYNKALGIKSGEQYPKDKISEIDKILADQKATAEKDKSYQDAISKADGFFNGKKYNEAKSEYNKALGIKSGEQYPKDKISEIDKILADQKVAGEKDKSYQDAISKADGFFNGKKYNEAKSEYNKALGIKSGEQYPKDKVSEIDKILAGQKAAAEKDKSYQDAISKADGYFNSKKYNEAKSEYNKAIGIKSGEQYPKDKISEINRILAEQKASVEKDKAYKNTIAVADGYFNSKKYNEAKSEYNKALGIKSGEQYPKNKISEIDKILADQKATAEKDKSYQDAISKADGYFNGKKYTEAKSEYNKALGIKLGEQYPKDKISEIDKILADQKATSEKDKSYQDAIVKADGFFNGKKYTEAKSEYNKALGIKSGEQYPKNKISEIDKILADQKAATEKDKFYQDAISKADGYFNSKKYSEAKGEYNKALGIKSGEQYPKDKISEIDKILTDQKATAEKDKAYKNTIAVADGYFNGKKYTEAKSEYNKALGIKSGEQYPKDRIAEIDKIFADQTANAEKDKLYKEAISKADGYFNGKKYTEAKGEYNKALGIKSGEQYPKDKILEIDKILADQKTATDKEKAYNDVIVNADKYFNSKKYTEAKREYEKAQKIKPTEQYPRDKIAEIDKIITDKLKNDAAALALARTNYKDAVQKADYFFNKKDYTSSEKYYRKALTFLPSEQYPKNKILEIKAILEKIKAEEEALAAQAEPEEIKFETEEEKQKFLSKLAEKYPEGITIENYTPKGKIIKRIIVVRSGVANDYREVKHDWGGKYYFKNGQSISNNIFYNETRE